ncbi:MAG TPA: zf-HC2 domain-containing protein, partial [Roseiflexaceae bacterium]|nr:zf-HC2 domain-containing protein [Roseiflexaceae bacterium]
MNTALPQLNDDDIELLSAYIDNELSAADRARLEVRLQAEPLLRTTLAELQTTVTALQSLETLGPPRSFTLDP